MPWVKRLRYVFYAEVVLNLVSIILIFFLGETFVKGFGLDPVPNYIVITFQWFAVLLIVITYIMARTLWSGDDRALRWILEGYLIGDIIYVVVQVAFVNQIGVGWTTNAIFGVGVTIVLIVVRVLYLWGSSRKQGV